MPYTHPLPENGPAYQNAALAEEAHTAFGRALVDLIEPLRRRAHRLTNDPIAAEDLLQETMIRAWTAQQSFQSGTNIRAWAYTILRNIHLSALRRSRRTSALTEHMIEGLIATDADQHQQAELAEVLEAIDRLPADQRSALMAVSLEGLDYASAACKLNVSQAALKSRVHRARLAISKIIDEGDPNTLPCIEPTTVVTTAATSRKSGTVFGRKWAAAKRAGQPMRIG